jgi:hypothetical protein
MEQTLDMIPRLKSNRRFAMASLVKIFVYEMNA